MVKEVRIVILLSLFCAGAAKPVESVPQDRLLDALWQVESSRRLNPPDGDSGRAIGPMQIWAAYWHDATHDTKGRQIYPGTYEDCRDVAYAQTIVKLYWRRYAKGATDVATLASLHHLGPNWRARPDEAAKYVKKVQAALAAQK